MEKGDDPYQILGVVSTASQPQVKKAYRYLAYQCHPDRQKINDKLLQIKFAKVSAAFELLMDEDSREEYENLQQTSKKRGFDAKKIHKLFDSPNNVFKQDFEEQFGFPYPGAEYDWDNHEKMAINNSNHKTSDGNHKEIVTPKKPSRMNNKPPRTQLPNISASGAPASRGAGMMRGHSTSSIGNLLSRSSGNSNKSNTGSSADQEKAPPKEKKGLFKKMFRGTSFRRNNYGSMLLDDEDEAENTPMASGSSSSDFPPTENSKRGSNRRSQSTRALVAPTSTKDARQFSSSRDLMKSGTSKEHESSSGGDNTDNGSSGEKRPLSVNTSTKEIVHTDGTVETVTTTRITRPDGTVETMRMSDNAGKRPGWKLPGENDTRSSEAANPDSKKQQTPSTRQKKERRKSGGDLLEAEARRRQHEENVKAYYASRDDDSTTTNESEATSENKKTNQHQQQPSDDVLALSPASRTSYQPGREEAEQDELTWEDVKKQMKEEIREELYQSRSNLKQEVRKEMEASGQLSSYDPFSDDSDGDGETSFLGEDGTVTSSASKKEKKKKKPKQRKSSKKSSLEAIDETGKKKKKSSSSSVKSLHSSSSFHDSSVSLTGTKRKKKKKQATEAEATTQ